MYSSLQILYVIWTMNVWDRLLGGCSARPAEPVRAPHGVPGGAARGPEYSPALRVRDADPGCVHQP